MQSYTKTDLANRAFDIVGLETVLNIDTATSADAKLVQRNFAPVMLRCLRKADWPFALKRISLNPSATAPENEFSYKFSLPSDFARLARLWPVFTPYKIEGTYILTDEASITLKYVSSDAVTNPGYLDPVFAEYFAHELAVAICYKKTDSVNLRKEIMQAAINLFHEASALFSQEDTDDAMPESPWITARYGDYNIPQEIRIEGLET